MLSILSLLFVIAVVRMEKTNTNEVTRKSESESKSGTFNHPPPPEHHVDVTDEARNVNINAMQLNMTYVLQQASYIIMYFSGMSIEMDKPRSDAHKQDRPQSRRKK
jgi:hypothetical protein